MADELIPRSAHAVALYAHVNRFPRAHKPLGRRIKGSLSNNPSCVRTVSTACRFRPDGLTN